MSWLAVRTVESILQVIRVLRPFWHCFAYQPTANDDAQLPPFFQNIEMPKRSVVLTPDITILTLILMCTVYMVLERVFYLFILTFLFTSIVRAAMMMPWFVSCTVYCMLRKKINSVNFRCKQYVRGFCVFFWSWVCTICFVSLTSSLLCFVSCQTSQWHWFI